MEVIFWRGMILKPKSCSFYHLLCRYQPSPESWGEWPFRSLLYPLCQRPQPLYPGVSCLETWSQPHMVPLAQPTCPRESLLTNSLPVQGGGHASLSHGLLLGKAPSFPDWAPGSVPHLSQSFPGLTFGQKSWVFRNIWVNCTHFLILVLAWPWGCVSVLSVLAMTISSCTTQNWTVLLQPVQEGSCH